MTPAASAGRPAASRGPDPAPDHRAGSGPVRVQMGLPGRIGALGPAVGNNIVCGLTWCAALTMGCAATCRFACISR